MYIDNEAKLQEVSRSLNRAFRGSEIKTLPTPGANRYVEGNAIIDRLNEAFSPFGWSFTCPLTDIYEEPETKKREVAVYGEITVHVVIMNADGSKSDINVTKGQWGAKDQTPNKYGKVGMEHGDSLKSAGTDAMKKCASLFGIGNHLSRKDLKPGETRTLEKGVAELTVEMAKVAIEKGYTIDQMLDFCSGVTRKTIIAKEDLTLTQAQACLAIFKDIPSIKPSE